jgi:hypothetical protein
MPILDIKYVESKDGIVWSRPASTALSPQGDDEFAFGRPFVIRGERGLRMFYSVRGRVRHYVIGYAESDDGMAWRRLDDEVGIGLSPSGWDHEMMYASSIFQAGKRAYLFYNGNGHGATGFGYAELARP